jgi:hypothetical protein
MTNTPKTTASVNPVGGEGGSPGIIEVEATETLTKTVTLKAGLSSTPTSVTNPTGGEGGSVG